MHIQNPQSGQPVKTWAQKAGAQINTLQPHGGKGILVKSSQCGTTYSINTSDLETRPDSYPNLIGKYLSKSLEWNLDDNTQSLHAFRDLELSAETNLSSIDELSNYQVADLVLRVKRKEDPDDNSERTSSTRDSNGNGPNEGPVGGVDIDSNEFIYPEVKYIALSNIVLRPDSELSDSSFSIENTIATISAYNPETGRTEEISTVKELRLFDFLEPDIISSLKEAAKPELSASVVLRVMDYKSDNTGDSERYPKVEYLELSCLSALVDSRKHKSASEIKSKSIEWNDAEPSELALYKFDEKDEYILKSDIEDKIRIDNYDLLLRDKEEEDYPILKYISLSSILSTDLLSTDSEIADSSFSIEYTQAELSGTKTENINGQPTTVHLSSEKELRLFDFINPSRKSLKEIQDLSGTIVARIKDGGELEGTTAEKYDKPKVVYVNATDFVTTNPHGEDPENPPGPNNPTNNDLSHLVDSATGKRSFSIETNYIDELALYNFDNTGVTYDYSDNSNNVDVLVRDYQIPVDGQTKPTLRYTPLSSLLSGNVSCDSESGTHSRTIDKNTDDELTLYKFTESTYTTTPSMYTRDYYDVLVRDTQNSNLKYTPLTNFIIRGSKSYKRLDNSSGSEETWKYTDDGETNGRGFQLEVLTKINVSSSSISYCKRTIKVNPAGVVDEVGYEDEYTIANLTNEMP